MSFRSERLKKAGWEQVSPRNWTVSWWGQPVDILSAERIQDLIEAGAARAICVFCGWPVAELRKLSTESQAVLRCYKCRNTYISRPR